MLDNTVLNVAMKTISDPAGGLGASQSQLEWAINSYTLVFAGLLFTFGVIGDRVGRRRMLIIGMALFGLSSLICSYAQTPAELIWARAAMGLGGAAVMPQTLSIITNVFDPRERPRAIGIWASAVGVAIAIGPVTGGVLLDHFWWGSVFLINVPLTAVGVAAIALLVPESKSPSPGRIDYLGVLLSVVGLVLLVYGIIRGGEAGSWLERGVIGPIAAGLAVLTVFCVHESRTEHPSLDVRLFRDPRLSSAAAAIGLNFFAMAGVYFFMSFYLQNVRGFSPMHAGLLTTPVAIGQLIASQQERQPGQAIRREGRRGGRAGRGDRRADRISLADADDAGRRARVHFPAAGFRDGDRDADGDRGGHVGGTARTRRRGIGDHQHVAAGCRRAGRRSARVDARAGIPERPGSRT